MLNNEQLPSGKHFYYLFDGLGSVVVLTGTGGDKENAYDYDPYGTMFNQTEGVSNPYKFAAAIWMRRATTCSARATIIPQ
jgi:uncharacterized protein RhaS with RHS repeats